MTPGGPAPVRVISGAWCGATVSDSCGACSDAAIGALVSANIRPTEPDQSYE